MASTRDLRRRIRSVKNTSQITKAMQMVSATKMRKAQNLAFGGRPYNQTLINVLNQISGKLLSHNHPLLNSNDSKRAGVVIFSTDKGLCGSLNSNLLRNLQSSGLLQKSVEDLDFYTVGKKGRDFLVRTRRVLVADFENPEKVQLRQSSSIRKLLVQDFLEGKIGEVYILYPDFVSALRQEPKLLKILPIDENLLENTVIASEAKQSMDRHVADAPRDDAVKDFLFEPNLNDLLEFALTHLLDTILYQAVLETKASEHSARMITMQNATKNASELVDDLTLTYNQLRQENITRELLEITSAGAALE